jgi:SP family general alpha glucoside:H+ symporter-like MFS transporter
MASDPPERADAIIEQADEKDAVRYPPRDLFEQSDSMDKLIAHAKSATDKEHKMTLLQGIKLYPKAVFWSILISTTIAMEGYDVCLVSNFFGFPAFNRKYGQQLANGTYQVPAPVSTDLLGQSCLARV